MGHYKVTKIPLYSYINYTSIIHIPACDKSFECMDLIFSNQVRQVVIFLTYLKITIPHMNTQARQDLWL